MSFGHDRERSAKRWLEEDGWVVIRSPASLGAFDLAAFREGSKPRCIEVKATAAGPYAGFGPADRSTLSAIARKAGADAFLLWWPKRKKPTLIPESDWPEQEDTDG